MANQQKTTSCRRQHIATIFAVNVGDALKHANLGTIPSMLGFIKVAGFVGWPSSG